jgi:hypothetical protein
MTHLAHFYLNIHLFGDLLLLADLLRRFPVTATPPLLNKNKLCNRKKRAEDGVTVGK